MATVVRYFDLMRGMNGLMETRLRKYQRKQDLARSKASWALFQQISADTKARRRTSIYSGATAMRLATERAKSVGYCAGLRIWGCLEFQSGFSERV